MPTGLSHSRSEATLEAFAAGSRDGRDRKSSGQTAVQGAEQKGEGRRKSKGGARETSLSGQRRLASSWCPWGPCLPGHM